MIIRPYNRTAWKIAGIGLIVLGLALAGCGGGGEAQAAAEWRIVTFRIDPDSFVFRSATTKPGILVTDGTTEYAVDAGGAVIEYDAPSAGTGFIPVSPLTLKEGEQVIERPADSLLTVIRLIE